MIENAIRAFTGTTPTDVSSISGGHINDSFLVTAGDKYVLQRMNGRLYAPYLDAISNNYSLYQKSCDKYFSDGWVCPKWLTVKDGGFFYADEEGSIFRMYRYIPSDEVSSPDVFETGKGLGTMHAILKECKGIVEIGPNMRLYDLPYYYRKYTEQNNETKMRDPDLDRVIEERIGYMLGISVPGGYVIHGDAKIGNMLYNGRRIAGFIDLDTIMPGSIFNDLADCARSCCLNNDNRPDPSKIVKLVKGYEEGRNATFTESAVDLLGKTMVRNMFMLGLRYYTDVLSEEGYFEGMSNLQKLSRARDLLL